jgi:lipopolysaccharide cholinephosphotransferase
MCGVYGAREVFPARIFKEYAEYEFEDTRLMGVKDYDFYLKGLYRNYMQLPPEKDRHGAHHLQVTMEVPES